MAYFIFFYERGYDVFCFFLGINQRDWRCKMGLRWPISFFFLIQKAFFSLLGISTEETGDARG
jgi:hypothetical protein